MLLLVIYRETADDAYKYTPIAQRRQFINKVLLHTNSFIASEMKKEAYNKSQKIEQCIWF